MSVKSIDCIYWEASRIDDAAERKAYLDGACGGNTGLRERVESLLAVRSDADRFLESPPLGLASSANALSEGPGTVIGPYKLLEQIGEGGFGVVYMAEQTQPVRRKVALKVLKPGMDTRQVVARFEAERQALALMDHPNIARVLDGGATATGRPYFVMELVRGLPITEFCDQHHLTPRQRLELFIPICLAVQHAHQKGIIHRDLKPSNILVVMHDTTPVPKAIDFGVSKALGQTLTDKTMFTGFTQMIGTPLYMSPEQAGQSGLDVDTRSDIYSLGVLLYELLTGTTPFAKERFKTAAHDEIRRIIREEDPPRPSTRLSQSGETLATISAQRQTEPTKLTRLMRGELDWIVMKSLEKDRNRRYETANGLALDIQRYLADEPVLACPPSLGYRLRKFTRRNKGKLAAAAVFLVALLTVVGAIGWALRDRAALREDALRDQAARQTRIAGQVQLILNDVLRLEREQNWPEALDAARRAADLAAGGDVDADSLRLVQQTMSDLELVRRFEDIRARHMDDWKRGGVDYAANAELYVGTFRDAGIDLLKLSTDEAAQRLRARSNILPALIPALDDCGVYRRVARDEAGAQQVWKIAGLLDPDPWRQKIRHERATGNLKALRALAEAADLSQQPAATLTRLASSLNELKEVDAAFGVLSAAQRQYPSDFWVHFEMAQALHSKNPPSLEQAAGCYRTALALRPRNSGAWNNLGNVLKDQDKPREALVCYQKAVDLGPENFKAWANLSSALRLDGRITQAVAAGRRAVELNPKGAGVHVILGHALHKDGKLDEAISCYQRAIDLNPKNPTFHSDLGILLNAQNKPDEAIEAYEKAIELDPKLPLAHRQLAILLFGQKRIDAAIEAWNKAVEVDPKDALAHFHLGEVHALRKQWDEAALSYRKAIEFDPKNVSAHQKLVAIFLTQTRDVDGAIEVLQKLISLEPDLAPPHLNLGVALSRKGREKDAIASLRNAIRLNPTYAIAYINLARLLTACADVELRDPREALEAARKAVDYAPQSVEAWLMLGWAQYRSGDAKASIAALEKSISLQTAPKGGDARQWFFLSMAHWQIGAKEEARRWYDQAAARMSKYNPNDPEMRRIRAEAEGVLGVK